MGEGDPFSLAANRGPPPPPPPPKTRTYKFKKTGMPHEG